MLSQIGSAKPNIDVSADVAIFLCKLTLSIYSNFFVSNTFDPFNAMSEQDHRNAFNPFQML